MTASHTTSRQHRDQRASGPKPPKPLRSRNLTARVIRQKVWQPPNRENDWCCFAIVGREGSGKSHTTLSIMEKADPSFTAQRVHFDPEAFLECINEMDPDERSGKAVVIDESGVGMGVRTWYDSDQINFNKVMQTARDDNMIVGMTLPRLSELDSQMRGRLHAFLEMTAVEEGEYARFKWKNIDPTRDDRDKIYKKYPRMRVNGRRQKVKTLAIGPPSPLLADAYEDKKEAFKDALYEDTLDSMADDGGSGETADPQEIADDIKAAGRVDEFVDVHGGNKSKYISWELLKSEYGLSHSEAKTVKKLLSRDPEVDIS